MPRKIRQLLSDLHGAGFFLVTVSGAEGDDAKTYQERQVKKAIEDASSGN